jgi:serine protease
MILRLGLSILTVLFATQTSAGTWKVGTASGYPGSRVDIPIVFQGDGISTATEVEIAFNETRLKLPVASGDIPGANQAGQCARTGSSQLAAVWYGTGVLPSSDTVVCIVPFTIQSTATAGRIRVSAFNANCAAVGVSPSCTTADGWVEVLGSAVALRALEPPETSSLTLLLRASSEASIDELVNYNPANPASTPLVAFQKFPPIAVRRNSTSPATGDAFTQHVAFPESPMARLERFVVAEFRSSKDRDEALAMLKEDASVEVAYPEVISPAVPFQVEGEDKNSVTKPMASSKAVEPVTQTHLSTLGIEAAWYTTPGWGLVGVLDNGLDPTHPELISFDAQGRLVPGGNYLPHLSRNVGGRDQQVGLLDEIQPSHALAQEQPYCGEWLTYGKAGHGTHVAGLVGANSDAGVRGACQNCGLSIARRTFNYCDIPSRTSQPGNSPDRDADGVSHLVRFGAQVINMSFAGNVYRCTDSTAPTALCQALDLAKSFDVIVAASSGNDHAPNIYFPARDVRIAAIGGIGDDPAKLWDEAIGATNRYCPVFNSWAECGSDWSSSSLSELQEFVAPAKLVKSTFYRGKNWSSLSDCGDEYTDSTDPAAKSDGVGPCTGTSMSAPIMSGIFGLLRSINPMMRAGDPRNRASTIDGVRDVVAQTASRKSIGPDAYYGYGYPDAAAAARKMLGTVRGQPVVNRVTPLFGLYSAGGRDYAAVAIPQLAMSLITASSNSYVSDGDAVAGYAQFPMASAGPPLARALVLTTPTPPYFGTPPPVPLYLMEKKRAGSVSCDQQNPFCHGDFILVSSDAQVQLAADQGYKLAGRQGYIYGTCSPAPSCVPYQAQVLHLKCNVAAADCAVFLEKDRLAFEGSGYVSTFPGFSTSTLGYAYPSTNTDNDLLPDAMELVIGTSMWQTDSDGDGSIDSNEYSMSGIPVSDPCQGSVMLCTRNIDQIFFNGFE